MIKHIDGVGYSGKVTVTRFKKGKRVKRKIIENTGTWELFRILCYSLAGSVTSTDLPGCIDVMYMDEDATIPTSSILVSPISTSDPTYSSSSSNSGTTNTSSITYKAYIYSQSLQDKSNTNQMYYVLKSRNGETVLAFVAADSSDSGFSVASDEVLVIEWTLTIGNVSSFSSST